MHTHSVTRKICYTERVYDIYFFFVQLRGLQVWPWFCNVAATTRHLLRTTHAHSPRRERH